MRLMWVPAITFAVSLSAQDHAVLTDAAVMQAITAGTSNKYEKLLSTCRARVSLGSAMLGAAIGSGIRPVGAYHVAVSGPSGRIALLAADAKRLYKRFGLADATDAIRSPNVYVTATPETPHRNGDTFEVASPIEAIVLQSKVNRTAIHPADLSLTPVEWKNLMGATFTGTSAVATFTTSEFLELPVGDIDVVLITAAGERRCEVGKDERRRVLQ